MTRFRLNEPAARTWLAAVLNDNATGHDEDDLSDLNPSWKSQDPDQYATVKELFHLAQIEGVVTCNRSAYASLHHHAASVFESALYWVEVEVTNADGSGALVLTGERDHTYVTDMRSTLTGIDAAVEAIDTLVSAANDVFVELDKFVAAEIKTEENDR